MTANENINETIRINKVLKEFNIGMNTLIEFLRSKKIEVEASPATKITPEIYSLIQKEFGKEQIIKEQSKKIAIKVKDITENAEASKSDETDDYVPVREVFIKTTIVEPPSPKIIGKIDLDRASKPAEQKRQEPAAPVIKAEPLPAIASSPKPVEEAVVAKPVSEPSVIAEAPIKKAEEIPVSPLAASPQAEEKLTQEVPVKEIHPVEGEKRAEKAPQKEIPSIPQTQTKEQKQPAAESIKKGTGITPEKALSDDFHSAVSRIEHIETRIEKLKGVKISGTIDLSQFEKKERTEKWRKCSPETFRERKKGKDTQTCKGEGRPAKRRQTGCIFKAKRSCRKIR